MSSSCAVCPLPMIFEDVFIEFDINLTRAKVPAKSLQSCCTTCNMSVDYPHPRPSGPTGEGRILPKVVITFIREVVITFIREVVVQERYSQGKPANFVFFWVVV